jgi:DNA polymerase III subunit alpha
MAEFTHLHVHTQYSILDGAAKVKKLIKKAVDSGMKHLAITDHGNMYGVMNFVTEARKQGIKPIIGCEVYVARNSRFSKTGKEERSGYHLILLAKNLEGYKNLSKLVSLGFLEGFYYTPRIDKEILKKYSEGLICSSACLGGEIPKALLQSGMEKAEKVLQEYLEIFGEDFYLEFQRHGIPEQDEVNKMMIPLAEKYGVKYIATNDVHFVESTDAQAHNILICINTNRDADDEDGMHYSGQEFLKTPEQMADLFKDLPDAIITTQEIAAKIEDFKLERDVILPKFPLPEGFTDEFEYLEYLTWEGAKKRYPEITDDIRERLEFELSVVKKMGFPGYFLIVQDFIGEARNMGVRVGPGRGSAAGSAVAYSIGITNIDPIKYNLLFERFLNPDRISMPDVDIDFDDEGRDRVIQYVIGKYGKEKVAQIATFGTMAAKSAIRDVARVVKLPLPDADRLAKLVPEGPKVSLEDVLDNVSELKDARKNGDDLTRKTLEFAQILEGSTRNVGTHACGVIIGPEDLINHIPLATAKDSEMPVTQYEGKYVESVGMLKMDFLGLKTLSIINDALRNIKKRHDIDIDIDAIPLDDKETYELYSRGDTTGTFQFESDGMKKYLQELKPNCFEDLIAMNALYRPGPMQYIPSFIKRKLGLEKVEYDFPEMEKYLKETYGITVYQEQVMLLSQLMGGFTKGEADKLRKAMGKKMKDVMDSLKMQFVAGCTERGFEENKVLKIWSDWEAFAEYAFNKSHSTCYSFVAYQTAYLKAHYPAEYMASVLTHNLNDITKITFFIEECKRQKIKVLLPDVNESELNFIVNKKGEIRFGMAAVKNVGGGAVEAIIEERRENGPYRSIFDLIKRINLRAVNRRALESLAMGGAFDSFEDTHRAQYFHQERVEDPTFIEKVIRYANASEAKGGASQHNLFGDAEEEIAIPDPEMPVCEKWSRLEELRNEKEVAGFYLSGHPLDDYKLEIETFCNTKISELKDFISIRNKEIKFAGIITSVNHRMTKNGKPFANFTIEDFNDSISITLFSEDYLKMKHMLEPGIMVYAKASVKNRWGSDTEYELKINSMSILHELIETLAREVIIRINLKDISGGFIKDMKSYVYENKGKGKLRFNVINTLEGYSVGMPLRDKGIHIPGFVKALQGYPNIQLILG